MLSLTSARLPVQISDGGAVQSQRKVCLVAEQASDMKEMAWRLHTDAPVLAEIDRAILQGDTDGTRGGTRYPAFQSHLLLF